MRLSELTNFDFGSEAARRNPSPTPTRSSSTGNSVGPVSVVAVLATLTDARDFITITREASCVALGSSDPQTVGRLFAGVVSRPPATASSALPAFPGSY